MSSKLKESGDTITVHLRLKPTKEDAGFLRQDENDPTIVRVNISEKVHAERDVRDVGYVNNSKTQYNFMFNSVLPMVAKQNEVFDVVGKEAVNNVLEGVNATIFAYGQTGSGKTFTITGGVDSYDQRGLIPRALSMVFQRAAQDTSTSYSVHISYLEIYNESGFDLLDPSHETKTLEDLPKVSMMSDEDGNTHLKNLSMHRANTEEEALNLLFLGDTNRAIAETPMNLASSRSHCLFTIFVESRKQGSDTVRRAKLHMVDLAGSERAHKTGSTGQTLREATYINSSLFYLEMVIVALHEKSTKARGHIPYRNSMMTAVLRDSLGGNCKTVMVATVSVEADQVEESISTCKFAQRVALIKNSAIVNEDLDPTVMIQRLKGEVGTLREELSYLKGEAGEGDALTEEQVQTLHAQVEGYVNDPNPNSVLQIGKMTLTKLKDAFAIFKNLILDARHHNAAAAAASAGEGEGGGGGGNGGSSTSTASAGATNSSADAALIGSLKEKLAQRDQEIAILVNMVKQAKAVAEASSSGGCAKGSASSSSFGSGGSGSGEVGAGGGVPAVGEAKERDADAVGGGGRKGEEDEEEESSAWALAQQHRQQQQQQQQQAKQQQQPRVTPVVCGVKLSADPALLQDANQAFEHFRSEWPRSAAIEDNKRVLKEKIDLAKDLYEKVMESRSTIGYLKKTIEQIRRERAMEREGLTGDGGGEDEDDGGEEQEHMKAMEREKAAYASSCNQLREEKAAIEHIQKLMTSVRGKLQGEFDEWYGQCLHAEARHAVKSGGGGAAVAPDGAGSEGEGAQQHRGGAEFRQSGEAAASAPSTQPPSSSASSFSSSLSSAPASSSSSASFDQLRRSDSGRSEGGGGGFVGASSGGGGLGRVELTGNKEADEDIAAFEKAREELYLMQRRQAQQRN